METANQIVLDFVSKTKDIHIQIVKINCNFYSRYKKNSTTKWIMSPLKETLDSCLEHFNKQIEILNEPGATIYTSIV